MKQTVKGYAKINLHLDICGIRDDGYHSVETVMQTVSLFDTVSVSTGELDGIECVCDVPGVPTDDKNIAVRAARLFIERTGILGGISIYINKRIPMAAGLAGGSADAAATLKALNLMYGEPLSTDELCELGSMLGADVPFCIVCGTAYTDGRGDVIHSFPALPKEAVIVVACGGEGVSTPWAYRLMDSSFDRFVNYEPKGTAELEAALNSSEPMEFASHLFNIFEGPVLKERPIAARIKKIMTDGGAIAAMMSGSGPSVYGIFDSYAIAEETVKAIAKEGFFACVCYPTEEKC